MPVPIRIKLAGSGVEGVAVPLKSYSSLRNWASGELGEHDVRLGAPHVVRSISLNAPLPLKSTLTIGFPDPLGPPHRVASPETSIGTEIFEPSATGAVGNPAGKEKVRLPPNELNAIPLNIAVSISPEQQRELYNPRLMTTVPSGGDTLPPGA